MKLKKRMVAVFAATALGAAAFAGATVRTGPAARAAGTRDAYNPFTMKRVTAGAPAAKKVPTDQAQGLSRAVMIAAVRAQAVRPAYRPAVRSPFRPTSRGPYG